MALQWQWKDKCGEAVFWCKGYRDGEWVMDNVTVNLYEGNAYLIFIYEWRADDIDKYQLKGFFSDKVHMKRCLGIDKKYKDTYGDNMYDKDYDRLVKIRFNKAKSRNYKEIITALVQAFDNIEIEVYTEKEEK